MRIIRAIVSGERDPEVVAAFRDVRCQSCIDTIKAALVGNDHDEHVFALTQSLELYDFYQMQIETCVRKLEAVVGALTDRARSDLAPLSTTRIRGEQHNAPSFDVRAAPHGVSGTNLTQIHGLGPSLALRLVAECGADLNEWRPWGGLALSPRVSGLALSGPVRANFPVGRPFLPLDRILPSAPARVTRVERLDSAAIREASDHRPLWGPVLLAPDSCKPYGLRLRDSGAIRSHTPSRRMSA